MDITVAIFQPAETSPGSQYLWWIIDRSSIITSTKFFSILRWIPSDPTDLWTFHWHNWPLIILMPTNGKSLLPQSLVSNSKKWAVCHYILYIKLYLSICIGFFCFVLNQKAPKDTSSIYGSSPMPVSFLDCSGFLILSWLLFVIHLQFTHCMEKKNNLPVWQI